ncbi:molybdate transport system substrate-binding protein [Kineococcus xinjiangensis]|uniref:Molybdate transport system substrate-binding protein n=1 Tax=Kineococcus xinjiangensis TaxID=512762 RepID=A0A2S6IG72_9ACTN|nr:molybdate ABC transporter substrate-binding protein [Kineococcus xinjiangensis]PPK93212.1 molybdate transport system substrate-binding protein [Kineococcus xinjiangensis]
MRRAPALAVAAVVAAALPGCGGDPGPGGSPSAPTTAELTVLAAASLRPVFEELGRRFEATHPGTAVEFTFAGSTDLVGQLREGAPADVLATADTTAMDAAAQEGLLADAPAPFATNTLQIVTPPENPARVSSFADLARPGVAVVVCAPQVPCGRATARAELTAGVDVSPVSEETSVTGVLGKVTAGEADAGIVYVTDARAAGGAVRTVPFPEAAGIVSTYPVAVTAGSEHPVEAAGFAEFLRGAEAGRVLAGAGFGAP